MDQINTVTGFSNLNHWPDAQSIFDETGVVIPQNDSAVFVFLERTKGKPLPALLPWKAAEKMVPWGVVLLLGGGFALAHGSQV